MIWVSRIISLINGGVFAYWSHLGTANPDWRLWIKFVIVSGVGFIAGDVYREAKMKRAERFK